MRSRCLIIVFSFSLFCSGQVSIQGLSLKPGKYDVGFQHYLTADSTRTYKRIYDWSNKKIPRQIPVSIWYPSKVVKGEQASLLVMDYMEILKEEEEWEYLPNDQILNWFDYSNTPENRKHLKEKTNAYLNAVPISKTSPVIIYAPGYEASSIENFTLFEFLASHGFVIISSPSRGAENRFFEGTPEKNMEAQARDIEFLIRETAKFAYIDGTKMATMGFSFGGLSNVLTQMRNDNIKAVVGLDGSVRYNYATLQKSAFYDIEKTNVPFIHMAQKDIPKKVLMEDKIDAALNYKFDFYDSLVNSRAYSLKFNDLTHSHFNTLGVLFQERDKRQDKSDLEIMESYKWMSIYTLNFLNAFLKDDRESLSFLEKEPVDNGIKGKLILKKSKPAAKKPFTFEDFNEIAANQGYKGLDTLYRSILKGNPSFKLEEGKLNNLGLQLVFNPERSLQGINVFLLATQIYPKSSNIFDSLAEAYLFTGDKKMAIKNFKRSLELNSENQNAIDRMKELKME